MRWPLQFSSPPPETVWSFNAERALVIRRDAKLGNRCSARDIPAETFTVGPAGLHGVDREKLGGVLAELGHSVQAGKSVGIVMPTAWSRVFLIRGEDLPENERELEDVLRWRLKKILPIPPAELRLATAEQSGGRGGERVILCAVGIEKALQNLEAAFEDLKWRPGLILPRILALSLTLDESPRRRLILQHEEGFFSLALVEDGFISFMRTKPLPSGGENQAEIFLRELAMARSFIVDSLGITEELELIVISENEELNLSLEQGVEELEGLTHSPFNWPGSCPDPMISGAAGRGVVEALVAVLYGGRP